MSRKSGHQCSVVVSSPFCVRLHMIATTEVSVPDRAVVGLYALDLSIRLFSVPSGTLSHVWVG